MAQSKPEAPPRGGRPTLAQKNLRSIKVFPRIVNEKPLIRSFFHPMVSVVVAAGTPVGSVSRTSGAAGTLSSGGSVTNVSR